MNSMVSPIAIRRRTASESSWALSVEKGRTRQDGRRGDSAVAVSPTISRKKITRMMRSGTSTSIGAGGAVALKSLPTSQTARIGTSTRPTPSTAAAMVRSRWPGSIASPRPKRRRRKRPSHHSATVTTAQKPSDVRSCSPEPSALRPSWPHAVIAAESVCTAVLNCGPSWRHTSDDNGETSRCSKASSMTWPRSLVRRSVSWSARAMITSHCLTWLSLTDARSVSRARSAFTASVSVTGSLPGLTSSGASSFLVSARSLRAMAAAALAAARTSATCSRSASISTGSRLACSVRVATRSSWRVQTSISWANGRCGGAAVWPNAGPAQTSRSRSQARRGK